MDELTDEEIAAMPSVTEADLLAIKQSEDARKAELQRQQTVRESALKKLEKLGLTEDEAKAVIGL